MLIEETCCVDEHLQERHTCLQAIAVDRDVRSYFGAHVIGGTYGCAVDYSTREDSRHRTRSSRINDALTRKQRHGQRNLFHATYGWKWHLIASMAFYAEHRLYWLICSQGEDAPFWGIRWSGFVFYRENDISQDCLSDCHEPTLNWQIILWKLTSNNAMMDAATILGEWFRHFSWR